MTLLGVIGPLLVFTHKLSSQLVLFFIPGNKTKLVLL